MEEALSQIGVNIDFYFVAIFGGLIWVRLLAMIAVVPFLFGKPVPMILRTGAATILAIFVGMYLAPAERPPITEDVMLLFMLFAKEAIYGFMMGFAAAMVFYGFEGAGHMIDNQRGMSIARILIPQLGTQGSLASAFLFQLAIVVYLAIGGHLLFFETLFKSFTTLPVLEFPDIAPGWLALADFIMQITGEVITMAIAIAAPVIIAILVADIILGVSNRVAPQINVWELGFNVKGYLGVLMLFFMMTLMLEVMTSKFEQQQIYNEKTLHYLERREPVPEPAVPEGKLPVPLPWLPERAK